MAFPHASLWPVPPVGPEDGTKGLGADLLLVGGREPQRLDWRRLARAFADQLLGRELRSTLVLGDPLALAATWTMGRTSLSRKEVKPSRDRRRGLIGPPGFAWVAPSLAQAGGSA